MDPTKEVMTLAEAAAYLRTAEETLSDMAQRQAIPARKIGNEWRFLKSAVIAWFYPEEMLRELAGLPLLPPCCAPKPLVSLIELIIDQILTQRDKEKRPPAKKRSTKEVLLEMAGKFKDDPFLEEI